MKIVEIELEEALAIHRMPAGDHVLVISMTRCEPCTLVRQAISLRSDLDIEVLYACVDRDDKRQVGKALLCGIDSFPWIEVYHDGKLIQRKNGVAGETPEAVANELMFEKWLMRPAERSPSGA